MPPRVYPRTFGRCHSGETESTRVGRALAPLQFALRARPLPSMVKRFSRARRTPLHRYTSCKLVNRGYTGLLRFVYRFILTACWDLLGTFGSFFYPSVYKCGVYVRRLDRQL